MKKFHLLSENNGNGVINHVKNMISYFIMTSTSLFFTEIEMREEMRYQSVLKGCLASALAFGMAACSSSTPAAPDSGNSEPAAAAFKLGGSGPTTGGASAYGMAVKRAAEIAVEEINAEGGLQFDLNFQDDTHDAEKAVTAYGVLTDWGMQVSLLTVTSVPAQAVAPLYAEDNVFAITPSGSSLAVIYADPVNQSGAYGNVFQMCFTDPNQGTGSADYLAAHPQIGEKIAVIYKNDDNYSAGVYEKFMDEAAVKGLNIVYEGSFTTDTSTDFSVQLSQAQSAGADLVFLPIYYDPASLILTQANGMGYAPVFFGTDGLDGLLALEGFDTSLAEGVYLLTPFSPDAEDEKTVNFVKKYQEKYNETPNQFAADAYDSVYALKQALESVNATPDMSASEICDLLVAEFNSMTFDGITGTSMTWSASGEVSKQPNAVVIKDGVYVSAE